MKKRITAALLGLSICMTGIPQTVWAEEIKESKTTAEAGSMDSLASELTKLTEEEAQKYKEQKAAAEAERKAAEEAKKAAEEEKKAAQEAKEAAEAEQKKAEEAKKAAEEEQKKAEEAKKAAEEEQKKAEEAKKAAEEEQKKAEEAKKAAEEEAARKAEEERLAKRQEIVDYALQFEGNPYVYGGTSLTNGTDCSGFVMSVFANFGYELPRVAAAQYESSAHKDLSELEIGDLVFYGSGITHVALYIGDGQIIHASNSRTGIVISEYDYDTPVAAGTYLE